MSKEKGLKISWRVLLAGMFILTVLFFLDIKFVALGINILVLDMLTAGIWAFFRLCRWAGHENTEKRTIAVIAMILMGLFAAPVLLFVLMVFKILDISFMQEINLITGITGFGTKNRHNLYIMRL